MDDLHDATFGGCNVDWVAGTFEFGFETAEGHKTISGTGFRKIAIPKEQPWGPSMSVNSVTATETTVVIELQSGDQIQIECSSWQLD